MSKKKLVIFDFNRTLYDPEKKKFIDGAKELIQRLSAEKATLILVSMNEGERMHILKKSGLDKYFSETLFVNQKSKDLFNSIIDKYHSCELYIVGDYLYGEIYFGNICGAKTIWLKAGKFSGLKMRSNDDKPSFTVTSLREIFSLLVC